jgi:magnesium chelatase subunit D
MGSNIAYLERHGHWDSWKPNLCWLAGCSRQEVGLISPHLLDRFALRLNSQDLTMVNRAESIRQWLQTPEVLSNLAEELLPPQWKNALKSATKFYPEIAVGAQKRVLDYISLTDSYSIRRELALLRLVLANAQVDEIRQVNAQQVDVAAQMIGLKLIESSENVIADDSSNSIQTLPTLRDESVKENPSEGERYISDSVQETVYASNTVETLPSQPIAMGRKNTFPYPEDTTPVQREAASLRLPLRRFKNKASGKGIILGVEPTTIPQDLAIVNTLLESVKYQQMRKSALIERQSKLSLAMELTSFNKQLLILQPNDLRRYRRATVAEQMLVIVIDYTCLRECEWQAALLPYLQWAYAERAKLCLIQVGAANATHELQAEMIVAQNILVPRINKGLEGIRGQATPLAHGLDLALQTLRHALQHGRSTVRQAVLVVVSDGRGNVPLEASRKIQKPLKPVNRKGIEDAFQVAQQISGLKQVEAVVLNPQPKYYADLPVKLAQALGAKISAIPLLKAWETNW